MQLYCVGVLAACLYAGEVTGVWIWRAADKKQDFTKWENQRHFETSSIVQLWYMYDCVYDENVHIHID